MPLPPAAPDAGRDGGVADAGRPDVDRLFRATSYRVERQGPGHAKFTEIAAGVAGTSFRDGGARPEGTYAYRVRAENAAGRSPYSPTASATTPAAVPPAQPASSPPPPRRGRSNWTGTRRRAPRPTASSRGPGEADFTQIASGLTAPGYDDPAVLPDSTYAYRVRAENAAGLSPYGVVVSATTPQEVVVGAYTGVDVGGAALAGSTVTVDNGKAYDLTAGGTDINSTADQFHFAYQQRTGDFDVKVRVASLTRAADWSKAGLMARAGLSAGQRPRLRRRHPRRHGPPL